jgi:short-subunit dehydrogenase
VRSIAAVHIGSGTRALVTGASRGIGRALAHELAARGATVGLAARSVSNLQAVAGELPGAHHVLVCDVALRESITGAVDDFVTAAGGLELLVVNAGIAHYEPVATQSIEDIELMTEVNWLGTVYTVKAALPEMLARGDGHIVVMSSGAGLRSFPGAAAYSATKAAQRMFGEALRHELAGTGVSLTTVYPGEVATSLHDHQGPTGMPAWYRGGDQAAPAEALAARVVRAVERDSRELYWKAPVRGMGFLQGVSPRLADAALRRLRGDSAAPRKD